MLQHAGLCTVQRRPCLFRLCAGRTPGWILGWFSSACCSWNLHWGPQWVMPGYHGNNGFRELVMCWMRQRLSGGRCDWSCDVSPNGSLGEDEKAATQQVMISRVCVHITVCVCVCEWALESNPCTLTFSPIKLYVDSWSKTHTSEVTWLLCNLLCL